MHYLDGQTDKSKTLMVQSKLYHCSHCEFSIEFIVFNNGRSQPDCDKCMICVTLSHIESYQSKCQFIVFLIHTLLLIQRRQCGMTYNNCKKNLESKWSKYRMRKQTLKVCTIVEHSCSLHPLKGHNPQSFIVQKCITWGWPHFIKTV